MKLTLSTLIMAFGSAFISAAGLQAQTFNMKANIPFTFQAAGAAHASGEYFVEHASNSAALTLRNVSSRNTELLGLAGFTEQNKGTARLTFHRYGNTYFLAEVWNAEQTGTKLPVSSREKEIRRGHAGFRRCHDSYPLRLFCWPVT